jgi:hypothetical protein
MKTLLQIVQEFCKLTGLPPPASAIGNTDDQIIQIIALINEGLDDTVAKYKWTQLQALTSFVTVATESQGLLSALAPGYKSMIQKTLWNNSSKLPGFGGITPQDSQVLRQWGARTAVPTYREMGGKLMIIPAPAAGQTYSFEYISTYPVLAADGITRKQYYTVDTDTCVLPDNLITLDLRWRWKSEKGLPYAEHMRTFETQCKQAYVDSLGAANVHMANCPKDARPGIVIPAGNWPV